MAKVYNFNYKGKIIAYSKEQFRKVEAEFKKYGRAIYRIFCSRRDIAKKSSSVKRNLEAMASVQK